MKTKEAIVINKEGFKVEYVIVELVQKEQDADQTSIEGEFYEVPLYYTLKEGESLIYDDIATALNMLKPRWDGKKWIEKATKKEIEASRPKVEEQQFQFSEAMINDGIAIQLQQLSIQNEELRQRLKKLEEALSSR